MVSKKVLVEKVADYFNLTIEERNATTSSNLNVVYDRVSWALVYIRKAGMIERPCKGFMIITDKGEALLAENPEIITNKILGEHSAEFAQYQYIPKYGVNDKRTIGYKKRA
mgnify:FL=1